jgi:transcriptional regulator of acetoin/glycerol metabolism
MIAGLVMDNGSTASFTSLNMPALRATHARLVLGVERGIPRADSLVIDLDEASSLEFRRSDATRIQKGDAQSTVHVHDGWMSAPHTRIRYESRSWQIEDAGSKNGTFVNGNRVDSETLFDNDVIEMGSSFFVFNAAVPFEPPDESGTRALIPRSHSSALLETYRQLQRVASSSTLPILVLGETGTGKEVAANLIHEWSGRAGEFCAINCAAIPPPVAESLLFGHKKGAFSGATSDHAGLIRAADGGTLFLDEIAELDLTLQAKLLRVLQEGEVLAVGASRAVPVDVRLVSATHADLDRFVSEERFRKDLLARLSGHRATLPPLRERREDLGILMHDLLRRQLARRAQDVELQRSAARAIYAYDWPWNVRELSQAMERSSALRTGNSIGLEHLPPALQNAKFESERYSEPPAAADDEARRAELVGLLTKHAGNVSAVAREMSKARVQIRRWCARFGVDPERFRSI